MEDVWSVGRQLANAVTYGPLRNESSMELKAPFVGFGPPAVPPLDRMNLRNSFVVIALVINSVCCDYDGFPESEVAS